MPILSGISPSNIEISSSPFKNAWRANPNEINLNYHQGSAIPAAISVATFFKDVTGSDEASGFTNLKYRTYIGVAPALPISVVMSGPLFTGSTAPVTYTDGLQGTMVYTFQNLNLLSPGIYTYSAYHQIIGSKIEGNTRTVSEYVFKINIRVFSSDSPTISLGSFDFIRTLGVNDAIPKTLTVTGTSWLLQVPKGFVFAAATGVTVSALPNGGYSAFGTGTKNITLLCTSEVVPATITENPFVTSIDVNDNLFEIPISVILMHDSGLFLSTEKMEFTAYKNISEAGAQDLVLNMNSSYRLSYPAWVKVDDIVLSGRGKLKVSVLSSLNMEAGIYTGEIVVSNRTANFIFGKVQIIYNVIGNIKSPYLPGKPSFTLDRVFLELSSGQDNRYFEVAMGVKVYDYYSSTFTESTVNFKVPLFKKHQTLNIGQVLHRVMKSLPQIRFVTGKQYSLAEVNLAFVEKSFDDSAYLKNYYLNGLRFIAGLKPTLTNNSGFLDINPSASRVTPNSLYYINFLASGVFNFSYYINGNPVTNLAFEMKPVVGIYSRSLDVASIDAKPGDVIEARLTVAGSYISKFFKVFPDAYESNHILWENEYKLVSVMEFTGKYSIKSELENRNQTLYDNLVDLVVKMESTKVCRLTINTGFLLQSDVASVESLCRSKKASLKKGDGYINLVPVQKTLTTVDIDRELVSFDIEFEINRAYNEEIYSF